MVSLIDSDTLPKRKPKVLAKPEAAGERKGKGEPSPKSKDAGRGEK